jgi:hypothetical protein
MNRAGPVFVLILLAAAAVLFAPTSALAAPTAVGTLNPPPASFQTCTATGTGTGTICRGTITATYDPVYTGISCGVGTSAFDVYDVGTAEARVTSYYDRDGNLTRRVEHFTEAGGRWLNLINGASVGYTQNNIFTEVLAVPGDLATRTSTTTGEIVMRPERGAPVLLAVGRQVFSPTGELTSAGPNAFVDGDPAAFDALCAVLA